MLKKPLIPLVILLVFFVLLFLGRGLTPVKFVSSNVQSIFSAPRGFLYSLRIRSDNNKEIKKLEDENAELIKRIVDFERIRRDNEALRSQFETAATRKYKLLPAKIIGFLGSFSLPTSLIIDRGETDGIKAGMAVTAQNNLIGKIGKVSALHSEIILTINPKFKTISKTESAATRGVIIGNEDFILLDRVSVNEELKKGAILLTAGDINEQGIGIPPDFILGEVASVNKSASLPFQTAKVDALIKFDRLETVFVMTGI